MVGFAVCVVGGCFWKDLYLYGWFGLYGVGTDMPADRQSHKCVRLLVNTWAQKIAPSPKTYEYTEPVPTCINRKAQNQSRLPQQLPPLKGNTESLCIYDIPLSAFLLASTEFLFCFAGRIFCFAYLPGLCQYVKRTNQ